MASIAVQSREDAADAGVLGEDAGEHQAEICALKMADMRVEPTRPMSSGGVSCWTSVCEGTMIPAAEKPMRKQPKMVVATVGIGCEQSNVPSAMPPRPR
jgi:hypothetical protein